MRTRPPSCSILVALLFAGCASQPARHGPDAFERHALAQRERLMAESPERLHDPETEQRIRARLCMIDAARCEGVRIYLLRRPLPVADMDRNGVLRINVSLLYLVRSVTELDFVLAHELAHLVLDHFKVKRRADWDATAVELEADAWARERLLERGLDPCAGTRLLGRIAGALELETAQQAQLPLRLERLGCPLASRNPDFVPAPSCAQAELEQFE
jgi:predicted Zn-dependent protease